VSENEDKYRVYLEAGSGQDLGSPDPDDDIPFCLGVLGDFSGAGTRSEPGEGGHWASRPLIRVTPENVLSLGGLAPSVEIRGLPGSPSPLSISFRTMEDFHPDSLFRRLDLFDTLRRAREKLLSGEGPSEEEGKEGGEGKSLDEGKSPGQGGLLDAVLGETNEELQRSGSHVTDDLDGFIRRVVRPHAVRVPEARTEELGRLDQEIGSLMRAVMHSPGFRSLESLWRSVIFLLSRIQTTSSLRVYLVDVSHKDLAMDLLSTDEPTEWDLPGLLLNPMSDQGEELRWAALVGAYEFGSDPEDLALLQRIALLAETADVPFVAQGSPTLAGCRFLEESPDPRDWNLPVDDLWEGLRSSQEGEWIGLAAPGFLLREAYGEDGAKAKTFSFREAPPHPDGYLWGNPAVIWGILVARAFSRTGWQGLRPESGQGVEGLPMYVTPQGVGRSLEAALSHSAASALVDQGLMPLVGSRDESDVRFARMLSTSRNGNAPQAWWRW
jgi:type VI secretion system protein ImpC